MTTLLPTVVLASAYFDEPLWTNKQHVAVRLARTRPVLYVEPGFSVAQIRRRGGFMPLSVTDRGPWAFPPGLDVISPLDLPLRRGPAWLKWLAWALLARRLTVRLADLGWGPGQFTYLVYHPEGVRLLDHLHPARVIYDCVDDLVSQPHFASKPAVAASLTSCEDRLIREADVVVATSRPLHARLSLRSPHAHYVPNVADAEHFARGGPCPPALQAVPHPRVAYSGALDSYKLDYDLLDRLLSEIPDLHLVLLGPGETTGANAALAVLRRNPRVHWYPAVPYSELPAWLHAQDALLMPYVASEHTRHIFPLKVFEYLATGRPMVSTPLESLEGLPALWPRVTGEAFVAAVATALRDPDSGAEARQSLARANTWDIRVARLAELIDAGAPS